jgi:predicted methyltransferase
MGPPHGGPHPGPHEPGHFADVASFAARFDSPERAAWQRPVEVMRLLDAAPGSTVADLGAGTGYFVPFLSLAVGAKGKVLALDAEPHMVAHLERRVALEGLANVETRMVQVSSAGLAASSVDRVLVVNTWHHLTDRAAYAKGLFAALKAGGSVLVVDYLLDSPEGPPLHMRLSADAVKKELEGAGFGADVVAESLPRQYAVRGTRSK